MKRRRSAVGHERGETLLELVVAITILGVCVVAVGAGVVMSVKISTIHRDQATADATLHNYAETVLGAYRPCAPAGPPNYPASLSLAAPAGFVAPTASVRYWDAATSTFTDTCPSADPGLEQVTLNLTSNDRLVSESLVVVVRKP